jgi:RNA polymerase sigma-70 factor, ECF subfamily
VKEPEPSDHELMRRFSAGDEEAFTSLVRRHQQSLMNFFRRLGVDGDCAEDCAQETFVRLFRYGRRYRPAAPFLVYLYQLARHSWVDWSRRGARWKMSGLDGVEKPAAREAVRIDDRLDLAGAIVDLPEHLRWVLVLSVERGLSYAEIAGVLGIPLGTVKSRMFHGVRRLKEALGAAELDR